MRFPQRFRSLKLKRLLACAVTDGPHETPVFLDDGVPFLSVDGIQEGELQFEGCRYVSPEDHAAFAAKAAPRRDDILMGKAASTGKIARVKTDRTFSIWSPLALIRVNEDVATPAFVEYALKSPPVQAHIDCLCTANTQKNIAMADIPQLSFPVPPRPLQQSIADFLDRETERIDALVAKKQQLIELLQEKRTALISHSVAKGLDPDAPVKDSGIEWLGSTPAHWDAGVIRRAARLESGHTPSRQHPEYWEDCSVPWFTLADIWQVRPGIQEYVSQTSECVSAVGIAHSSARLLPAGTVLLSRTASVGFSAIAQVPLATSQDFANWVCGDTLLPAYLLYVFRSMRGELMRLTMGSTHKTIYMPIIAKLAGPLPSVSEQRQIVEHIRRETRALDALNLIIGDAIERLREYRSALVTAAVTGQIDVRTYRRDPEEVLEAN